MKTPQKCPTCRQFVSSGDPLRSQEFARILTGPQADKVRAFVRENFALIGMAMKADAEAANAEAQRRALDQSGKLPK